MRFDQADPDSVDPSVTIPGWDGGEGIRTRQAPPVKIPEWGDGKWLTTKEYVDRQKGWVTAKDLETDRLRKNLLYNSDDQLSSIDQKKRFIPAKKQSEGEMLLLRRTYLNLLEPTKTYRLGYTNRPGAGC